HISGEHHFRGSHGIVMTYGNQTLRRLLAFELYRNAAGLPALQRGRYQTLPHVYFEVPRVVEFNVLDLQLGATRVCDSHTAITVLFSQLQWVWTDLCNRLGLAIADARQHCPVELAFSGIGQQCCRMHAFFVRCEDDRSLTFRPRRERPAVW